MQQGSSSILEILLFLRHEMENCQGVIGCGWLRFATNKELSGQTALAFLMQKYVFCLSEEDKKENPSNWLIQELLVLFVAQEPFHVSATRICHFGSDVHFLPSSRELCFQFVVLRPFEVMKVLRKVLMNSRSIGLLVQVVGSTHRHCKNFYLILNSAPFGPCGAR